MGIFNFFYYMCKSHKNALSQISKTKVNTKIPFEASFDFIGVDVNAVIHPVCQDFFKRQKETEMLGDDEKEGDKKDIYDAVCDEIFDIVAKIAPKRQIFLAIDGIAGMSKISQQRKRRFLSAKEKTQEEFEIFDSNKISPGTAYMQELSERLEIFIDKNIQIGCPWEGLEVIYSSHRNCGEGEHKLTRYISDHGNKNYNYCIYSPDADLIMLTLLISNERCKNIYLLRRNIYPMFKCEFFLVDILKFKKNLIDSFKSFVPHTENSEEKGCNIIRDFVFLLNICGNDFVSNIHSVDIGQNILDIILELYPKIVSEHGHFMIKKKLSVFDENTRKEDHSYTFTMNKKSVSKFIHEMALMEEEILLSKINAPNFSQYLPDPMLMKYVKIRPGIGATSVNLKNYSKEFNMSKFHIKKKSEMRTICNDFFTVLNFTLLYYTVGIPSWTYHYPHDHSPFFFDLKDHIDQFNVDVKFEKSSPLKCYEQLLCVLPRRSRELIPECLRCLMDEDSVISDFYPENFTVDSDGKKYLYQAHILLPDVSLERLRAAIKTLDKKFTPEEMVRNKRDRTIVCFLKNGKSVCKYIM